MILQGGTNRKEEDFEKDGRPAILAVLNQKFPNGDWEVKDFVPDNRMKSYIFHTEIKGSQGPIIQFAYERLMDSSNRELEKIAEDQINEWREKNY